MCMKNDYFRFDFELNVYPIDGNDGTPIIGHFKGLKDIFSCRFTRFQVKGLTDDLQGFLHG